MSLLGEREYPVDALREGWEAILLHQFHDILPGSSIRQVYEDAAPLTNGSRRSAGETLTAALDRIAWQVRTDGEVGHRLQPLELGARRRRWRCPGTRQRPP